jgi:hypothetical protein
MNGKSLPVRSFIFSTPLTSDLLRSEPSILSQTVLAEAAIESGMQVDANLDPGMGTGDMGMDFGMDDAEDDWEDICEGHGGEIFEKVREVMVRR